MKTKELILTGALLFSLACSLPLHAQTSAWTYQGSLSDNGGPASGIYDLRFRIYDVETNGVAIDVVTNAATEVVGGLFTVTLDFGSGVFDGSDRWLEIGTITNGGGAFSTLSPRQPITATPYALRALNLSSNALASFTGAVSFTNPSNTFAGDGSLLSNINVSTVGGLSASNIWQLGGNAGTSPGVDFLGTTDNQALEFKVNNLRALRIEPGAGAPNVIGGIAGNSVAVGVKSATIGGGGSVAFPNVMSTNTDYGTIGGGEGNVIFGGSIYTTVAGGGGNVVGPSSSHATVGGGLLNYVGSPHGTIGGGWKNAVGVDADYSTIAGGCANVVGTNADYSTIGGGNTNSIGANSSYATISGGRQNDIGNDSFDSVIGGGGFNLISYNAQFSAIGGGGQNIILSGSVASVIGGGLENEIAEQSIYATIGGGGQQNIGTNADYATIGGGYNNTVEGERATIGGGYGNTADGQRAVVAGGYNNSAAGNESTVGGGIGNKAYGGRSTVGGGTGNVATNESTTVSGGSGNTAIAQGSAVGGGESNTAGDYMTTVGGGKSNTAMGSGSTVAGGSVNLAGTYYSTVGGGLQNLADANTATVAGGQGNRVTGASSVIAGGRDNTNSGSYATVPGGRENVASGSYSFAAGYRAKANHNGAFVWADSTTGTLPSTNINSVTFRAAGGYRLFTDSAATLGAFLSPGGTSWSAISDRNAKKNFEAVDATVILEKLAHLPIQKWNYKSESSDAVPHIGPMAQDFKGAFYPGRDDTSISTLEFDGVALAAIQGLNQKLEHQLEQKETEITELRQQLDELKEFVITMNHKLNGGAR